MRKIFWIYLIVIGLVMVWYIPPFQKADEIIHFQNTASIVGGKSWVIENRFLNLAEKIGALDIAHKGDKKYNGERTWNTDDDKKLVTHSYLVTLKSYVSYFPAEIGVWLGSFSKFPVMALYLGRMAGLIVFLICIWISLRLIPAEYSILVMAYALIPMVLHQATEVSYDVPLLCLAPVILAVFLKSLVVKKYYYWLGLLTILCVLFALVKPGYYFMVLMVPVVLWAKFKMVIIKKPWIMAVVILMLVPVVIYFVKYIENNVGGGTRGLVNGNYQLAIIKHDPWQVVRIIKDTWDAKRDFYFKSTFGYFGWLDYEYDLNQFALIVGLFVAMVVGAISKMTKPVIGWVGLIIIGGIVVGTYLLIEMGFFFQWTVVGSTIVEGVQGRYLLSIVPLFLFWLSQLWLLIGKDRAKLLFVGLALFVVGNMTVNKISKRYYDNSTNFSNPKELAEKVENIKTENKEIIFISSIKKLSLPFHSSDEDVIGGFEMPIRKMGGDIISVPYRYTIKDKECTREITWGYIDTNKIKNSEMVVQKIKPIKPGFNDLCLEIEPLIKDTKEKYFDYQSVDDEMLVRLLYVSNQVK